MRSDVVGARRTVTRAREASPVVAGDRGTAGRTGNGARDRGTAPEGARDGPAQPSSASWWYAIDWNDSRCSGETPCLAIAARCSGVE
jgi:hypothetical protein